MLNVLLVLAVSASEPPPPPIINGEIEEGFAETVGLGVAFGDDALLVCTGALITPRVILSAAHCGDKYPIEAIVSVGSAFFGTDSADPDAVLRFEDAALHPDYVRLQSGSTLGENDIAVLILEEDAPFEPAWLRLDPFTEDEVVDETVVSVGYGLNESGQSDGFKRSAELTVDALDEVFLRSRVVSNPGATSICSGDSGGPQFFVDAQGRHIVWGVHSWADQACRVESGSTRVDVVADWLLEQVEATHGTDDLCEAAGRYDDGICDAEMCTADPDCVVEEPKGGCAVAPAERALAPALVGLLALAARRRRGMLPSQEVSAR